MDHLITILAFTVIVPLGVGACYYNKLSSSMRCIVSLCAVWFVAEIFSFVLRIYHVQNVSISYILTLVEIHLFTAFYYYTRHRSAVENKIFRAIAPSGSLLVPFDYIVFNTPFNTFSLTVEYIILTVLAFYYFYEVVTHKAKPTYLWLNFTLLFYMLSSFPYFFAWEWLRVSDMDLLKTFALVHGYVHAACYFILTLLIWRQSTLSFSAR